MDVSNSISLSHFLHEAQGSEENDDADSVSSARTVNAENVDGSDSESATGAGPVGQVYKVLERANTTSLNSTRVAKLCTDLIFATVMQKAGEDINEQQFEDAMVRAALRNGMGEQIQNLAKTSAATLHQAFKAPESQTTQPCTPTRARPGTEVSPPSPATSASTAAGPPSPPAPQASGRERAAQLRPSATPYFAVRAPAPRPAPRSPRADSRLEARTHFECNSASTSSSSSSGSSSSSTTSPSHSDTSGSRSASSSPARLVPLPTLLPRRNTAPLPEVSPQARQKSRSQLGPFARRGSSSSSSSVDSRARAASVAEIFEACGSERHAGLSKGSFVQLCRRCHQLCRNCDLTSGRFTTTDAEQIFASLVVPSRKHMDLEQFEIAVARLADKMGADEHMVRRAIVAAGVPGQTRGERKAEESRKQSSSSSSEHATPVQTSPSLSSGSPTMLHEVPEAMRSPARSRSMPGLASPSMSDEKSAASPPISRAPMAPFLRPSFVPAFSGPRGFGRQQRLKNLKSLATEERSSDTSAFYTMHRPANLSDAVDKLDAHVEESTPETRVLSPPRNEDAQQKPSFLRPSCLAGYSIHSVHSRQARSSLQPISSPSASSMRKNTQPRSSADRIEEAKQTLVDAIISGALGAALTNLKKEGTLQQAAQSDTTRIRDKCSQNEAKQAIWDATMSAMANLQKSESAEATEELAETRVKEVQEAFLDLMSSGEAHAACTTSPKSPEEVPQPNCEAEPQLRRSFLQPSAGLGAGMMHNCMKWNPTPPSESPSEKDSVVLRRSFPQPSAGLGAGMIHNCMKWKSPPTLESPSEKDSTEQSLVRRSFPQPAGLGAGMLHKCMKWKPTPASESPSEKAEEGAAKEAKAAKLREVHSAFVDAVLSGKLQAVMQKLRKPEAAPEQEQQETEQEDDVRATARQMVNWAVNRCRSYDRAEKEVAPPPPAESPSKAQPVFLRPSCAPGHMMVRPLCSSHQSSTLSSPASSSSSSTTSTPCSRPSRPTMAAPAARRPSRSASKVRLQKPCRSGSRSIKEEPPQPTAVAVLEENVPAASSEAVDQRLQLTAADPTATVEDVYNSFCSVGRTGMSSRGFIKFCKHCKLLDNNRCTTVEAEQIYAQVVPKGHRHISYQQFDTTLKLLSETCCLEEDALRVAVARAGPNQIPMRERRRSHSRNEACTRQSSTSSLLTTTTSLSTLGCDEKASRALCPVRRCNSSTTVHSSRTPSPVPGLCAGTLPSDARLSSITPKFRPGALAQAYKSKPLAGGASNDGGVGAAAASKSAPAEQPFVQENSSIGGSQDLTRPTPPPAEDFAQRAPRKGSKQTERLGELLAASSQHRRSSAKATVSQHARDALDVALINGATQHCQGISVEECARARRRASDALGLALLAEAYDAGLDITHEEFMKAKDKAQGALEFTLMTKRDLHLGSEEFQDVKAHARNALQVGLSGAQRDTIRASRSNEQLPGEAEPRALGRAQDAIDGVLQMFAEVRYGRLSPQQLEQAKGRAIEAVNQALAIDVEMMGLALSPEAHQKAARRAHVNLDTALLSQDVADEEPAERRKRTSDSIHLAILGVQLCA